MEGIYDSSLTFGASLKLPCLIGLEKQGFEYLLILTLFFFQLKIEFLGSNKTFGVTMATIKL